MILNMFNKRLEFSGIQVYSDNILMIFIILKYLDADIRNTKMIKKLECDEKLILFDTISIIFFTFLYEKSTKSIIK